MPKGNKGEWSEIYAFAKLLADGQVFGADKDLNPIPSEIYKIEEILREGLRFHHESSKIAFYRNGVYEGCYSLNDLLKDVPQLLSEINAGTNSFESAAGSRVMNALKQTKLKAPATQKTDLIMKLRDPRSAGLPDLGFSIKSYLGSLPTLFNASHATKFVYEIEPVPGFDFELIKNFSESSPSLDQTKAYILSLLDNSSITIKFDHMMDDCCRRNFMLVDSFFPQIFAEAVLIHYCGRDNRLERICEIMEMEDPLFVDVENYYTKKVTDFLVNVALGMEPATPWNAVEEANGGYIVVKNDGNVVCYNLYDRGKFRGYLLRHCKFDTPSATKFLNAGETTPDGMIYFSNGKAFINLNRQIRFC